MTTAHHPWLAPDQRHLLLAADRRPGFFVDPPVQVFDPRLRLAEHRTTRGTGGSRVAGHRVRASHRPWSTLMLALQWLWWALLVAAVGVVLGTPGRLVDRPAGRQLPVPLLVGLGLAGLVLLLVPVVTGVLRRRADRGSGRGLQVWAIGCAVLGGMSLLVQAVRFALAVVLEVAGETALSRSALGGWALGRSVPASSVSATAAALDGQLLGVLLTALFVTSCVATAIRLNGYLKL
jgi:hypothetical protein